MGIPNVTIVKVLYSNLDNLAEVMLGAEDRLATLLTALSPWYGSKQRLGSGAQAPEIQHQIRKREIAERLSMPELFLHARSALRGQAGIPTVPFERPRRRPDFLRAM